MPESGVRTGSLQSGEVDAIGSIGPQDEAPLTGTAPSCWPGPTRAWSSASALTTPARSAADPAVRRALLAAINRRKLVTAVYTSQTKPATSILASTTPDYAYQ